MLMINSAIAMLLNKATNRWHPIVFSEAPFPGAPSPSAPIRLRSRGRHTEGFDTRDAAVAGAHDVEAQLEPAPAMFLEADIEWDGKDVPAMHLLCTRDSSGGLRLLG